MTYQDQVRALTLAVLLNACYGASEADMQFLMSYQTGLTGDII